jgi:N-acetylglucosaminyl-diphospho-decaprenol L-rhamnosyltransferase
MVSIIIVNFNSGALLQKTVDSIFRFLDSQDFEVIVIDNNSTDSSFDYLKSINGKFSIFFSEENLGFSKGCNLGSVMAKGEYLLFLNPDTEIINVDFKTLIDLYLSDSRIGSIGIKQIGLYGVNKSCANFPTLSNYWLKNLGLSNIFPNFFSFRFLSIDYDKSQFVDQVIGSFLFISKQVFNKFNGFDERFFVFYEEMDLALRMNREGYLNYYFSENSVFHLGGGTTSKIKKFQLLYSWDSRIKFFEKHFSLLYSLQIKFITLIIEPFSRIIHSVLKFKIKDIFEVISAWVLLLARLSK